MERAGVSNAVLDGDELDSCCVVTDAVPAILERAAEGFAISVRAQRRVLRIARTIADMVEEDGIGKERVAGALALRGLS